MKKLMIVLVVLVVVAAGAFFFIMKNMDSLITRAVNTFGSEILQAEVRLKETKIDLNTGKGALHGLKIGNPQGFETDKAFQLDQISITLDTSTLAQNPVVIKEIAIVAPQATYELSSSGSNVDALKKNAESYLSKMGAGGGGGGGSAPSSGGGGDGGTKLIIERLTVTDGKVGVSATLMQGKEITVTMPKIELKNIGKDSGGASIAETVKVIIDALQGAISKAVAPLGLDKVGEAVGAVVGKGKEVLEKGTSEVLGKGSEAATDVIEKGTGAATDAVEKGVKGVGDALGGLLGGN